MIGWTNKQETKWTKLLNQTKHFSPKKNWIKFDFFGDVFVFVLFLLRCFVFHFLEIWNFVFDNDDVLNKHEETKQEIFFLVKKLLKNCRNWWQKKIEIQKNSSFQGNFLTHSLLLLLLLMWFYENNFHYCYVMMVMMMAIFFWCSCCFHFDCLFDSEIFIISISIIEWK